MKEINPLDALFERIRNEKPEFSYEEAVKQFELSNSIHYFDLFKDLVWGKGIIPVLGVVLTGSLLGLAIWKNFDNNPPELVSQQQSPLSKVEEVAEIETPIPAVNITAANSLNSPPPQKAKSFQTRTVREKQGNVNLEEAVEKPILVPPGKDSKSADTSMMRDHGLKATVPLPVTIDTIVPMTQSPDSRLEHHEDSGVNAHNVKEKYELRLRIKNDADEQDIKQFIAEMARCHIDVEVDLRYLEASGKIHRLFMQLNFPAGYQWDVKAFGFRSLEN